MMVMDNNIWHSISSDRVAPEDFICVIEISKGSKNKYELDKETGCLMLDRILHTSTRYPANYGFIPRTYGDDGDPLDVLLLCTEPIQPMTLVRAYPIGVISMLDNGLYKALEHKTTAVNEKGDRAEAVRVIQQCLYNYIEKFTLNNDL